MSKTLSQDITIKDLAPSGYGSSNLKLDNQELPIEVKNALPGEKVHVNALKRRKKTWIAQASAILTPSSSRITPKCCHFPVCGGCSLQHISYSNQLKYKQAFIRSLYEQLPDSPLINSIIPSPKEWNYRNKMEFNFSEAQNSRSLGLSESFGYQLVDISMCKLAPRWFIDVKQIIQKWWDQTSYRSYFALKNKGLLHHVTIREGTFTKEKSILLRINGLEDFSNEQALEFAHWIQDRLVTDSPLHILIEKKICQKGKPTTISRESLFGSGILHETVSIIHNCRPITLKLAFNATSFLQPNSYQAPNIYQQALEMAELKESDVVYDLYAGVGAIGLFAAHFVHKVYAIEIHSDSCHLAKKNALNHGITNYEVIEGDVPLIIETIKESPTVVFVDPPRSGLLPKGIAHINALKPHKIVYISCNPESQFKDIQDLHRLGYSISKIQPIDQFPHTPHMENLILLTSNSI